MKCTLDINPQSSPKCSQTLHGSNSKLGSLEMVCLWIHSFKSRKKCKQIKVWLPETLLPDQAQRFQMASLLWMKNGSSPFTIFRPQRTSLHATIALVPEWQVLIMAVGKCRAVGPSRWLPQQCLRLFILGTKLNCWQMLTSSQCSGTQGSGWPTGEEQQWQLQLLIAQKRGSFGHGALLRSTKVGWSQETAFWMMSS